MMWTHVEQHGLAGKGAFRNQPFQFVQAALPFAFLNVFLR
jgi:hypothetical protein